MHQKHKRETEKTALANKTIYTLIWYAFYDLRSGNGVGPILTAPKPTRGTNTLGCFLFSLKISEAFDRIKAIQSKLDGLCIHSLQAKVAHSAILA